MRKFSTVAKATIIATVLYFALGAAISSVKAQNLDPNIYGPWLDGNMALDLPGTEIFNGGVGWSWFNHRAQTVRDNPDFMLNATWLGGVFGVSQVNNGPLRRDTGRVTMRFTEDTSGLSFSAAFSGIEALTDIEGQVHERHAWRGSDQPGNTYTYSGGGYQSRDTVPFDWSWDERNGWMISGEWETTHTYMDGGFYRGENPVAAGTVSGSKEIAGYRNNEYFSESRSFDGVFRATK